jgi:plasmid stabilization system protein ParE
MAVKFLVPAQAELVEATAFYDSQKSGLGSEFKEEVKRAIERILQYPEAWPLLSSRTRRCRTKKFPYGIIYQIRGNDLLIVAVMHFHRDPQTWRSRLITHKE